MTQKMGKFDKFREKLGDIADVMQSNIYFGALSEGIAALMPIIFVGSMACLIANNGVPAIVDYLTKTGIKAALSTVQAYTLNAMALYATVSIAYRMTKKIDGQLLPSIFTALAAFLLLTPMQDRMIVTSYLGAQGLFMAMFCGLFMPKFIKFCDDKGLHLKLPAGVPPYIAQSFSSMISVSLACIIIITINFLFTLTPWGTLPNAFYTILQIPFQKVVGSLGGYILTNFLGDLSFFFGVHGSAFLSIVRPAITANSAENLMLVEQGLAPIHIINSSFAKYATIGGAGATTGICFYMLFFAKSKRYKMLGKLCWLPQLCNINEPILYGLPVILNPIMAIPYLCCTAINTLIAYGLTVIGVIPILKGAATGLGIPGFVNLWMNGAGVIGVALWFVLVVLDALIWMPFFKVMDKKALEQEKNAENTETATNEVAEVATDEA